MKLSDETIGMLKWFSTINQSIEIKPGNEISTISSSKTILAKAQVGDNFPAGGAIYSLPRFLGVLTLFEDPELEFEQNAIVITGGNRTVNYTLADPSMIVSPPDKDLTIDPDIELSAVQWKDLDSVLKAAAVMQLPEIAVTCDGASTMLRAFDSKNPTSDAYSVTIAGAQSTEFNTIFKAETLKLVPGDYDIVISSAGLALFKTTNLKCWVAAEERSTYG